MAFTVNCDLYGAVHEDGINLIASHILKQRPSLFNYATAAIVGNPELACQPVPHTADVTKYKNSLFHLQDPLPVLSADAPPVGLNYAVQLVAARIDFFPENKVKLPAELNPPLKGQHFSAMVRVCGGVDCPDLEFLGQIPPGSPLNDAGGQRGGVQQIEPRPRKLHCFCLDAFLVGHLTLAPSGPDTLLVGVVDGVDIVDIKPDALEDNINCYLLTTFSVLLREKLTIPIDKLFLDLNKYLQNSLVKVSFSLSPNPPIPNNPAIEDDQVKLFLDLKVTP